MKKNTDNSKIEKGCNSCKHSDKLITEEPCMICNCWSSKWEEKDDGK